MADWTHRNETARTESNGGWHGRAQDQERGASGIAFSVFFALAAAAGEFPAFMVDGAFKDAVMVGAAHGSDVVSRRFRGTVLEQLLQFALGIFQHRNVLQAAEGLAKMARHELFRRGKTAVEKNRAEHGLEGVGQRRGAFATAVGFLAAAENEMFAEAERAGFLGEGAAVHQFGAGLGERAFAERGKFFIQFVRQYELQHGVAEELEPLVVLGGDALFVGDGRMGERELQQRGIGK